VGRGLGIESGQFLLQRGQDLLPMLPLPLGLCTPEKSQRWL
jgi:hypothetical protein